MSRTHRTHLSAAKRSKRGRHGKAKPGGQPVVRSDIARAAWDHPGAGPHDKPYKAERHKIKQDLRKETDR